MQRSDLRQNKDFKVSKHRDECIGEVYILSEIRFTAPLTWYLRPFITLENHYRLLEQRSHRVVVAIDESTK